MCRIALVSPYTLPFYSGNSILVERLREGLTKKGFKVAVFNAGQSNPDEAIAFAPDILHSLNADKTYQWTEKFFSRYSPPWVITLTGTDYNTWCDIEEPPVRIRKCIEKASALVVFHEEALRSIKNALPEAEKKIWIINQGVSSSEGTNDYPSVRRQLWVKPDDVVFLMVAGIRPVKNLGLAIEVFSRVEKRMLQTKLMLIGPIMDQEEADRILAKGKTLTCFRYLGERHPTEVRKIMGAADVFLNTSLHEGMPGTVLEAMAEGLPVLASAVTGNRVLVQEEENGLLYPLGDAQELIMAIIRLAGDKKLRKRLGETGKHIATTCYSVEQEIASYQTLYSSFF